MQNDKDLSSNEDGTQIEKGEDSNGVKGTANIDYPVIVLSGYSSNREYKYITKSVDDPNFELLEDFPLDPVAPDSPHKVMFTASVDQQDIEIDLPYGLVVVFGRTSSGKSELLKYLITQLRKKEQVTFIRFKEPELPTMIDPYLLSARIREIAVGPIAIGAIDSFRHQVFSSENGKSAAGKGGINTGIYEDLTNLSVILARRKKTLIAIINPSTDDDSADIMAKGIEGAVAGMFIAKGYQRTTYVARTIDNNRDPVDLDYMGVDRVITSASKKVKPGNSPFDVAIGSDDTTLGEAKTLKALASILRPTKESREGDI